MGIKKMLIVLAAVFLSGIVYSAPVTVDLGVTVNTNTCDTINWTDSYGLPRSASVVKALGNPHGYKGGYFSKFTYMDGASAVNINESSPAGDLSGLGFMINHVIYLKSGYAGRGWINSKQDGFNASTSLLFQGTNHAIYQTEMDIYGDDADHAKGSFKAKWIYMVRTGNDYIVDSIAYDFSSQPAGTWGHDIRSPYCEINWTGTGASNTLTESIDGIEFSATDSSAASWIFKTTGSSPFSSGYTYNTPGKGVPYTLQWKDLPDREVGYVSTLDFTQQAAAGGFLSAPVNIGSTSASMPPNWGVNYQANGFQSWYGDKMTWQMPYGAAGGESSQDGTVHKSTVPDWTWRKDWPAYPTNGFTLLIHMGKKTDDKVRQLVAESSDIHSLVSPLTASVGSVVTTGKMNLYSTEGSFTLKPAGYNHIYHAWEINCVSDRADVTLALGAKTLKNQTFIFNNYNQLSAGEISINAAVQTEGSDMFTSVDNVNKKLYVTFNKTFTGTINIALGGAAATATYTYTVDPLSTATFTSTPTATLPAGTDCLNFSIDRSAVSPRAFMKKLTLKVNVGTCSSVVVYADGVEIPSVYNSATGIVMFTTTGNDISIMRAAYSGGGTGTVEKAVLYNDKKWAYSFTFDDGRPNTRIVAKPVLDLYGFKAGVAVNTQNMTESTDGYVMSWQSLDTLFAAGWSVHNHNYSHQAATCANISTETLPVKTAIEARYPGYINTHFVYPYVNTTEWACIRDSGYFLSAEVYNGNNYADTLSTSPFLLNRNSMMSAGNAGTAALANALADNAAS
ncbi:MAG TPA: polysaccharide deacetylase family protein, partial [Candidatus Goldiibacteriota bacterium]|nr:polysaccharide deacetylase family protein [Candidatus Goldiibacteriota bacterium]